MSTLGDRMKDYEGVSRTRLTRRVPMLIRCDGRAFHTFTRGCERPYDTHSTRILAPGVWEVTRQREFDAAGERQVED